MRYGYIFYPQNFEQSNFAEYLIEMKEKFQCDKITFDKGESTNHRREWKSILSAIEKEDTLVVLSFDNILGSVINLTFFLKLIVIKNIHFVSIKDEIDTEGIYFNRMEVKDFFRVLGFLPEKIGRIKRLEKVYNVSPSVLRPDNKENRKKAKEAKVLNMYQAGYNVNDIMTTVGYKTRCSIYNILTKYNIEYRRNGSIQSSHSKPN